MNFNHSISNSKNTISRNFADDLSIKNNSSNSDLLSLPSSNQQISFDPITPWDVFWTKAKEAQLVDSEGRIIKCTFDKYPFMELNNEEIQGIIDILEKPMLGKFGINYTLLEYFQYLLSSSTKELKLPINSINLVGGILPSLIKKYYIRTLDNVYKKQCEVLNIECTGVLISEELAADFERVSPDTDIVSTIDSGDLGLLVNLNTRFFATKLRNKDANIGQKDQIIRKNFYLDLLDKPDFSFVKLASDDVIIDSTFVHKINVNRCLFSHHGMKLNIMPLILQLNSSVKNSLATIKNLKLVPNNDFCSGWEAMFARAGKKIVCKDNPNEWAWAAYISNKSTGYGMSDPNIELKLFHKMNSSNLNINPLPLLKKKVLNHHFNDPLVYITLAFNAIMSLQKIDEYSSTSRLWWDDLMCEHNLAIEELKKEGTVPLDDEKNTFLFLLKKSLDCKTVSVMTCTAILQIYGSFLHSSFQSNKALYEIKGVLTNPESLSWHEVSLSQIIDQRTYAICMPLNLSKAITTLLNLNPEQLDVLEDLINHVCPNTAYVKALIPTGLITNKLIDQALQCFDNPHKALKRMGYEILLIHALSMPQPWVLISLVKYLPTALIAYDKTHHARVMANFEEALKGFPDEIKTHRIISSMIDFCHLQKENSPNSLTSLCLALVTTEDSDLIHEAVNVYLTIEGVSLDDQIHFFKTLLPLKCAAASRLLLRLQKEHSLSDDIEFKLIMTIADAVKKLQNSPSYSSEILRLSNCADQLCQRGKIYQRQVCCAMAKAFYDQNKLGEAEKWFLRILKTVSKSLVSEAFFFVPQKSYLSLVSIDLPPNPTVALQTLSNLNDDELKLFIQIMQHQPRDAQINLSAIEPPSSKESLVNQAKECLKNSHPLIKKIGFELIIYCAKSFPIKASSTCPLETKNADFSLVVDQILIKVLISYLPLILFEATPEICDTLLNALSDLLSSCFGTHAAFYLVSMKKTLQSKPQIEIQKKEIINGSLAIKEFKLKEIYQANCMALASTRHLPLCIISIDLFSLAYLKKLAPKLNENDQIDIALATIQAFLPEHALIALKAFQKLEFENKTFNTKSLIHKKNEIFTMIIESLIAQNYFTHAKECLRHQIIKRDDVKTTDLWLNLLQKTLSQQGFGIKSTVEFWNILKKAKGLPAKHCQIKQIDFMVDFIKHLYTFQNSTFDDLVSELQSNIKTLFPSEKQKSELTLIILNDLMTNPKVSVLRLTQSYKILMEVDLNQITCSSSALNPPREISSVEESSNSIGYYSFLILWLKTALLETSSLNEEIYQLLSKGLKFFGTEKKVSSVKSDEIFCIYDCLIKALNYAEKNSKTVSKEFKNQIISHHLDIVKILQASSNFDLFLEYFSVLNSLNILETNTQSFAEQALGLAQNVIIKHPEDLSKLHVLHKLLQLIRQNRKFITLLSDSNKKLIPNLLATTFLKYHLHAQGKEWINVSIEMHKALILSDADLSVMLIQWCELLLDVNQTEYCLTIFQYICDCPNISFDEIRAQICFKILKAISTSKPSPCGALFLENWNFLKLKISQSELEKLLEDVTQNILKDVSSFESIMLFLSLTKLICLSETEFLLKQFQVFCKKIASPQMETCLKNNKEKVVFELESTFFPAHVENSLGVIEAEKFLSCRFKMVKSLFESLDPIFTLCGLIQLERFRGKSQNNSKVWIEMCDKGLQAWYLIADKKQMSANKIINSLIMFQSKLIAGLPILDQVYYEKKLELFKLRHYLLGDLQTVEHTIDSYLKLSTAYLNDLKWIQASIEILIDAIFFRIVQSADQKAWFFKYYLKLVEHFQNQSYVGLNFVSKRMVERSLELNLSDSGFRSFMLYSTGLALNFLISDYMSDSKTENIFTNDSCLNIDHEAIQNVKEVIILVEKYLFCLPVLEHEWVWNLNSKKTDLQRIMDDTLLESSNLNIELKRELFLRMFYEIVQKLEDWGYDNNYPLHASIFQLVVYNKMNYLNNEKYQNALGSTEQIMNNYKTLTDFGDFSKMLKDLEVKSDNEINYNYFGLFPINNLKKFKNVTTCDQINAIKKVVLKLISQTNHYSSFKALDIFCNITEQMWKIDLKDLIELFIKVIDDDNLYPVAVEKICVGVVKLAELCRNETKSLEMSTRLCQHLLGKLDSNSIFKYILESDDCTSLEISRDNLESAFMLFPKFLAQCIFDKENKLFVKFFENQLDLFFKTKIFYTIENITSSFVLNSLAGMSSWSFKKRKNVFDAISLRFNLLFPFKDESLENILNLTCLLVTLGYFKTQPKHLIETWNMIVNLFPSSRSSIFYCNTIVLKKLVTAMSKLYPNIPENKEKMQESLSRKITPYITSIIIDDFTAIQDNVNMLMHLDSLGYFDNNLELYKKILEMFTGHILKLKAINGAKEFSAETFAPLIDLCDVATKVHGEKGKLLKNFLAGLKK